MISCVKFRRLALIGGLMLLGASAGCGARGDDHAASDPEAARRAVSAALDAWKSGTPGAEGTVTVDGQPCRVADEDWLAGARLIDYQLVAAPDPALTAARPGMDSVSAQLTLATPRGRKATRTVVYQVTTAPSLMIVRQD